jgi:nucleoid-associated protein YgaU
MQRIERYGVIALVVLLVTILALSLWGENKDGWMFWKKDSKTAERVGVEAKAPRRNAGASALDERTLPMNHTLASPFDAQPGSQAGTDAQPSNGTGASLVLAADSNRAPRPGVGGDPLAPFPSPLSGDLGGLRSNELSKMPERTAEAPILTQPPLGQPQTPIVERSTLPAGTRKYVVKNGDTLGEIASRELGSTSLWPEIQKLNASVDPARLREGMELVLPAGKAVASSGAAKRSSSSAKTTPPKGKTTAASYVIKKGDSLTRIAANELGSAKRWTEIRDLNPGIDADHLVVGAKLALPGGAGTTVASAPSKERIGWGPSSTGRKSRVQ